MARKDKIGLVRALTRRNSAPLFCALLPQARPPPSLSPPLPLTLSHDPQEETVDAAGWREPAGLHLVPLPFADDIRAAPVERAARGQSFAFLCLM